MNTYSRSTYLPYMYTSITTGVQAHGLGSNRKRLELPFVATANMYFYRFIFAWTQTLGFTQSEMHVIED